MRAFRQQPPTPARTCAFEKEAAEIQSQADALTKRGEALREESERAHHRADRFDLGELGVELALVLCSLAVLTAAPVEVELRPVLASALVAWLRAGSAASCAAVLG